MMAGSVDHPLSRLRIAWTLARRELRSGLAGFRVFLACLFLGVTAIAAVGSVSSALVQGLAAEGQNILSGDVTFRLVHRPATEEELAYLSARAEISRAVQMRAMARAPQTDERTLVELKSVDGAYPLYGTVTLDPVQTLDEVFAEREGRFGVAVEDSLLSRLKLDPGDEIHVGDATFTIRAVIVREPDRVADGFAMGPRVLMSDAALQSTNLVQLGSLIRYYYRARLPLTAQSNEDIKAFVEGANAAFPNAGWQVQDRSDSAPGVKRFVGRVALFLTLVGLTALVVGGVGVGNAVTSYLDSKRDVIAIFKCLGAPGSLIFNLYLMQILVLASGAIAAGLLAGALVPFVVQSALGDLLPVPARLAIYGGPLIIAAVYGFLAALAFAIWPLAKAREIPAAGLFRALIAPVRRWPRPAYLAAIGLSLAGLAGLAVLMTGDRLFALWFVLGAIGSFALLRVTASGLMAAAQRAGRPRRPELRLALANLYRPGAATVSVVLSLGLGLSLLVTISLIDGNISEQIDKELPDRAPAFFFVDIQPDQVEPFTQLARSFDGVVDVNRVPMLRGRVTHVNGVSAESLNPPSDVAWMLRGDRGITYARDLPQGSTLVKGNWWPADYQGPLLVSISDEMAQGFGLDIGDTLTVNILGRELTAEIANLRAIDWTSVGINFVLVFSPEPLAAAPHTFLATLTMTGGDERAVQRAITDTYPNVTSIRVKEALDAVSALLEDFALAIRAMSAVTLTSGVLVLAGAMAAGYRRRVYDAVLLKVLGAGRRRILGTYILEYAILGLGTALIAALIGGVAAWGVVTQLMEGEWTFLPGTLAGTVLVATLVTIGLGLAGTWRVLGVKAARILRTE